MNYKDLTLHERINMKSYRESAGPKLHSSDLQDRMDTFSFWNLFKTDSWPLVSSDRKNIEARERRRFNNKHHK